MQTHTFIAATANEAVDRIRAELGPAAVVLSVRKLPRHGLSRFLKQEQIEVVAAVQQEPPKPSRPRQPSTDALDELRRELRALKTEVSSMGLAQSPPLIPSPNPGARGIPELLEQSGILPQFCPLVLQEFPADAGLASPSPEHFDLLHNILRAKWRGAPPSVEPAVHVFVGVPGSGKSTVLCKRLAQICLVEQQPAAVYQLDSHLSNTSAQIPIYAEVLGARCERTLPQNFEPCHETLFIDLPGVSLGDATGLKVLKSIIESFGAPQVHLVLNAAYESGHLLAQTRFFAELGITDLVLTHLDEEPNWGKAWNLVFGTNYSIALLSSGQNVPGDLLTATADLILARQFR